VIKFTTLVRKKKGLLSQKTYISAKILQKKAAPAKDAAQIYKI